MTHTQEGHTTTGGPARPHPHRTPHDSRGRTPQHAPQTPYRSHQRTPTIHRKPHRGWRAHLDEENGAPPRPHSQATTAAATRATSQAPEEDKGTATATRDRDRDPQRTWDQGTGPQGGQPHGRPPDPPARAARPGPHSTDPARHPHLAAPPSHQPATLWPALRTTTQARLTSTDSPRHNARQHGTLHHSAPKSNAPQHDATRCGTERHNTAQLTLT